MIKSVVPLGLCVSFLTAAPTWGAESVFQIDPQQSSIQLSGTMAGRNISPQGAGGLTTTVQGELRAVVTDSAISFPGGSTLDANVNGIWQPSPGGESGSAPADYGAQVSLGFLGTGRGALRNLVLDLTSPALTVTAGQFDARNITFSFPSNSTASLDYNTALGSGRQSLSGAATNAAATTASIATVQGVETLTINIDTTFLADLFSEDDSEIRFTGRIVATRAPQEILEIAGIEFVNNQVRITASGATDSTKLVTSTNFTNWLVRDAQATTNGTARVYTLFPSERLEFFRLLD